MIGAISGSRQKTIHAFVRRGEARYVAECVEIAVVTQGDTLDETAANLREAVALHLEGEDLAALGLASDPVLSVTFELDAVRA
ncbi:MAG TPA: type II toxin-antitoxin system HicB family antitoxin [Chloroflexota bacterium]|nr:type II toxin-antitoxin system HicB family antitoxin [Chloroflexota bacterium]